MRVRIGTMEDPWCEIDLTEEDVEDFAKAVDITEAKLKEVIQLPPITVENCRERDIGDLDFGEICFEAEANGNYWHAVVMALDRLKTEFKRKQKNVKNLDQYLQVKQNSDKRNPKYYV
eukprot:TRINITY_DN38995_c0_g1_i1.p1 TRINITY_DN38995_c0_g1~~TRINITY_DN38995_c0_g1_i1.p1  ORF type:complete len:118 (+),score=26.87 TRINITY_DN38995_c0_g1_i1:49-402(+)